MGRARRGRSDQRNLDGILLLDKPAGATSNAALQRARRLFRARKAGHTGSLDPLATGMLPVCFGNATKLSAFLLDADKRYRVTARLGLRTDTADAEGEVIERSDVRPDEPALQRVVPEFTGEIEQVPPMFSALKHKGKRLYELARQGIEVERSPRPVTVYELALTTSSPEEFVLDVRCSKGTYVRTLVEDLAAAVGALAHVTALRRLWVGPFSQRPMRDFGTLEAAADQGLAALDALLEPLDAAVADWPALSLGADSAYYFMNGQPVMAPSAGPGEGPVRVYDRDGQLLALGELTEDGRVAPRRLFRR